MEEWNLTVSHRGSVRSYKSTESWTYKNFEKCSVFCSSVQTWVLRHTLTLRVRTEVVIRWTVLVRCHFNLLEGTSSALWPYHKKGPSRCSSGTELPIKNANKLCVTKSAHGKPSSPLTLLLSPASQWSSVRPTDGLIFSITPVFFHVFLC